MVLDFLFKFFEINGVQLNNVFLLIIFLLSIIIFFSIKIIKERFNKQNNFENNKFPLNSIITAQNTHGNNSPQFSLNNNTGNIELNINNQSVNQEPLVQNDLPDEAIRILTHMSLDTMRALRVYLNLVNFFSVKANAAELGSPNPDKIIELKNAIQKLLDYRFIRQIREGKSEYSGNYELTTEGINYIKQIKSELK